MSQDSVEGLLLFIGHDALVIDESMTFTDPPPRPQSADTKVVDRVIVLVTPEQGYELACRPAHNKRRGVHIAPNRFVGRVHDVGEQKHQPGLCPVRTAGNPETGSTRGGAFRGHIPEPAGTGNRR